jgi:hypothetical protein
MKAGPKGLLGYDLPKTAHTGHLSGLDYEVRIEGEDANNDHNNDANDQAKQERWAHPSRPLALQNKFWRYLIAHDFSTTNRWQISEFTSKRKRASAHQRSRIRYEKEESFRAI